MAEVTWTGSECRSSRRRGLCFSLDRRLADVEFTGGRILPWLGVVAIVPIANIVLLWFLACCMASVHSSRCRRLTSHVCRTASSHLVVRAGPVRVRGLDRSQRGRNRTWIFVDMFWIPDIRSRQEHRRRGGLVQRQRARARHPAAACRVDRGLVDSPSTTMRPVRRYRRRCRRGGQQRRVDNLRDPLRDSSDHRRRLDDLVAGSGEWIAAASKR